MTDARPESEPVDKHCVPFASVWSCRTAISLLQREAIFDRLLVDVNPLASSVLPLEWFSLRIACRRCGNREGNSETDTRDCRRRTVTTRLGAALAVLAVLYVLAVICFIIVK